MEKTEIQRVNGKSLDTMTEKIFTEYGLDFDNNRFGLGRSTEIEHADGSEIRITNHIPLQNKHYYFRLWIFKRVLVISRFKHKWIIKNRHNFKIVFGISGTRKKETK